MAKRRKSSMSVKILLGVFFFTAVILPVFGMFRKIQIADFKTFILSEAFGTTLFNSFWVSIAATLISVFTAYLLAFAMNRTHMKGKGIFTILITLPMLIPSVSHGIGLINLFGDNGILTNLLGINSNLYGPVGIVFGSVMYSFPVAFLMLSDAMKYADGSVYEAAKVLGVPPLRRFKDITLHYMKRPLISALFAVFTLVFTDYGVPLAVGGRFTTLPVFLYREVMGLLNFSKGAIIGMVLLVPAIVAFVIDLKKNDNEGMGFSSRAMAVGKNGARDTVFTVITAAVSAVVVLILSSFALMTFLTKYPYDLSFTTAHVSKVFDMGMTTFLTNSLLISLLAAVTGTLISYVTAYFTARSGRTLSNKVLHLISISSLAIPGMVLGLGYIITFKGSPLYGTIGILVLVNIIHFFASPYLMAYNAMKKINANMESVGETIGVGRFRLVRDVFIPCTADTIAEMFGYVFVNSMITISAITFLASTANRPMALMINELQNSMQFEAAAFVSLVILFANIAMKLVIAFVKKRMQLTQIRGTM